jgi:RNA recognition motif-containing protein
LKNRWLSNVAIDPRGADLEREDEALRSSLRIQGSQPSVDEDRITPGGHLEQGSTLAPLQGTKVVITNLETSVSQEDIMELCEDVGPLKRAKLVSPGHAEVFFVNHSHAKKAVDIYNNRLMDEKPMRCQLVAANSVGGPTRKLSPSVYIRRLVGVQTTGPKPDLDAIHQALFRKNTGKKPTFTITLPKKCKDDPEDW